MQYAIQQIAEITGGQFLHHPPADATIEHILLDSRQVTFPASSLFVALPGRQHDGHDFIEALQAAGVRNFLVSRPPTADCPKDSFRSRLPTASFLFVNDPLAALQALAAHHRRQFNIPVIGITGSNGKTVVKEWLFQLLRPDHHIVRSPKSYNSQVGVPLSVLQMTPQHTLAIFEAGISQTGEMEKLATIIAPTIGVFTNLGEAHSEGFSSKAEKMQEKWRLFENCRAVVLSSAVRQSGSPQSGSSVLRGQAVTEPTGQERLLFIWSRDGQSRSFSIFVENEKGKVEALQALPETAKPQQLSGNWQTDKLPNWELPNWQTAELNNAASIENAITCWAVMRSLGYPHEVIAERMARLEPVAMRLELKEAVNGCTIINDSYNSDLTSLQIALDFLAQQAKTPRRTLVLSDILQSGQSPGDLYAGVAKLLVEKKVDRLIGIGREVAALNVLLPQNFDKTFFENTAAFLAAFPGLHFRNETILLKGARDFGFERIADRLAAKVHQTTLEVNLTALLNNLRVFQSHLRPGTKLMVMVKASAYGSGSTEVAKLLEFQHVDYLGVAYADEGVELRNAGIQLPILVLNPEEATFDALLRHRLEPEIYSLDLLEKFLRFAKNWRDDGRPVSPNIHLKLDTGMHRLGFEETDLDALLRSLPPFGGAGGGIKSIFTHLAASEAPVHDNFTREQVERFQKMYERIAAALGYRPMRHVLNSGGIVRFPEYQLEMVRLGIGLYGIDGSGLVQARLQTVNTLKATVSQVKKIAAGETIGYGRQGRAGAEMRLATLSIGYADGLLRRAGNGHFSVLIRGQRAPLVGNVCMDMVMADVTQIPGTSEGDEVIIFGKNAGGTELPVQELADCLGTIPYEIFTSISNRVKRVYVQE